LRKFLLKMTNNYLYRFNFECNIPALLKEANDTNGYKIFEDPANTGTFLDYWKIKKVNNGYAQELADYFSKLIKSVDIRPRFYIQQAGSSLGWHVDRDTLCSINIVLNGHMDPISFRHGTEFYNIALLNTQQEHAVLNVTTDRILFKLSIFDVSYNNVRETLKKCLN
jgi:hypothetical protein